MIAFIVVWLCVPPYTGPLGESLILTIASATPRLEFMMLLGHALIVPVWKQLYVSLFSCFVHFNISMYSTMFIKRDEKFKARATIAGVVLASFAIELFLACYEVLNDPEEYGAVSLITQADGRKTGSILWTVFEVIRSGKAGCNIPTRCFDINTHTLLPGSKEFARIQNSCRRPDHCLLCWYKVAWCAVVNVFMVWTAKKAGIFQESAAILFLFTANVHRVMWRELILLGMQRSPMLASMFLVPRQWPALLYIGLQCCLYTTAGETLLSTAFAEEVARFSWYIMRRPTYDAELIPLDQACGIRSEVRTGALKSFLDNMGLLDCNKNMLDCKVMVSKNIVYFIDVAILAYVVCQMFTGYSILSEVAKLVGIKFHALSSGMVPMIPWFGAFSDLFLTQFAAEIFLFSLVMFKGPSSSFAWVATNYMRQIRGVLVFLFFVNNYERRRETGLPNLMALWLLSTGDMPLYLIGMAEYCLLVRMLISPKVPEAELFFLKMRMDLICMGIGNDDRVKCLETYITQYDCRRDGLLTTWRYYALVRIKFPLLRCSEAYMVAQSISWLGVSRNQDEKWKEAERRGNDLLKTVYQDVALNKDASRKKWDYACNRAGFPLMLIVAANNIIEESDGWVDDFQTIMFLTCVVGDSNKAEQRGSGAVQTGYDILDSFECSDLVGKFFTDASDPQRKTKAIQSIIQSNKFEMCQELLYWLETILDTKTKAQLEKVGLKLDCSQAVQCLRGVQNLKWRDNLGVAPQPAPGRSIFQNASESAEKGVQMLVRTVRTGFTDGTNAGTRALGRLFRNIGDVLLPEDSPGNKGKRPEDEGGDSDQAPKRPNLGPASAAAPQGALWRGNPAIFPVGPGQSRGTVNRSGNGNVPRIQTGIQVNARAVREGNPKGVQPVQHAHGAMDAITFPVDRQPDHPSGRKRPREDNADEYDGDVRFGRRVLNIFSLPRQSHVQKLFLGTVVYYGQDKRVKNSRQRKDVVSIMFDDENRIQNFTPEQVVPMIKACRVRFGSDVPPASPSNTGIDITPELAACFAD